MKSQILPKKITKLTEDLLPRFTDLQTKQHLRLQRISIAPINLFKTVLIYFEFINDFKQCDKSILEKIKAESKNHLHRFWHAEIRTCFFCKYPIQEYMYLSVRYANSLNILQSFDFVIVDILNTFAEADMFAGHNAVKPFLQSNCFTPQCGKNLFYSGFSFHHYFQITICQKLRTVMRI